MINSEERQQQEIEEQDEQEEEEKQRQYAERVGRGELELLEADSLQEHNERKHKKQLQYQENLSTFRSDAHPGDFLNEQLLQLYGIYYFKEEHLEVGGMPNSLIQGAGISSRRQTDLGVTTTNKIKDASPHKECIETKYTNNLEEEEKED